MKQLIFIFLLGGLLSACSLQKRRYMSGYHIASKTATVGKSSPVRQQARTEAAKTSAVIISLQTPSNEGPALPALMPSVNERPQKMSYATHPVKHTKNNFSVARPENHLSPGHIKKKTPVQEEKQEFMADALLGFIFSILSFLLFSFSFYSLYVMSVTSITVSLGIALFGVFIYLAAIALNLTAIQKKIHDPQRYNGLGLAIAGMAVCFFFLMVAASFFISGEFFLH